MAIDTATKRASVQNYSVGAALRPVPDSTISEGDRAMVTNLYQGMDYDAPVAAPDVQPIVHGLIGFPYWLGL